MPVRSSFFAVSERRPVNGETPRTAPSGAGQPRDEPPKRRAPTPAQHQQPRLWTWLILAAIVFAALAAAAPGRQIGAGPELHLHQLCQRSISQQGLNRNDHLSRRSQRQTRQRRGLHVTDPDGPRRHRA